MAVEGVDAVLLSLGADLPYFTGYEAMPLERLTMAVVPADGPAALVVPRLEAPRVTPRPDFDVRAWEETDDPVALVASLLPDRDLRVAIGDQTWAVFLLRMEEALPKAQFQSATPLTRPLRASKDADELELLGQVAAGADRVAARLDQLPWAGRTERQVAADIAAGLLSEGHERVDFTIVASGPNGASPHHDASDRVIEVGDVVVCDFGGTRQGYRSDITRCVCVGEPEPEVLQAWELLRKSQQAAFEAVRPGIAAQEVDRAARQVLDDGGVGELFIHRTGHGIGLETHEHPYIVEGNQESLAEGMTFSIEPGIYQPGRFGLRLEDIVAVTADGARRLNQAPRQLVVVD